MAPSRERVENPPPLSQKQVSGREVYVLFGRGLVVRSSRFTAYFGVFIEVSGARL